MSFGQERIWFLYRFEGPSSTYNITPVFRLRGPLSEPALHAAFRCLTARHETLRMRFAEIDGVGVQIADPPGDVPLQRRSLAHLAPEERLAAAERIILEETARPFDLERGHPLRVTLLALAPDDHILLPFMHHIVSDGWSLGVLQRELGILYEAFVAGRPATLPPLAIAYPEFALAQRAAQESERGREGLAWWRSQLAGAPQTIVLPYDFARPAAMTFAGRVLHRTISEAVTDAVAARGRGAGCSLFMTLLAAYGVLLHHRGGQRDLLIGSPVAGRSRREFEDVIGCFVNTVVLRLQIDGDAPFTDLLRRVRASALDAYARQDVPIEAVIDAVVARRDPARNALFQTQFSLQNVPVAPAAVSRLAIEHVPMDRVAAKNDLSFILQRRDGAGIHAELEYNSDLFREETVDALGADYVALLERIAAAPETPISALAPRPPRSAPSPAPPAGEDEFTDLVSGFEAAARRTPHAAAVRDDTDALTYAELERHGGAIAAALLARGVRAEMPVGLLTSRSVTLVAALLGILKAGGAYVPLSPDHPPERLRFMLAHAGVPLVVVDAANAALARELAGDGVELVFVEEALAVPARGAPMRAAIAPSQLAYIIFTSGSTGRPKGVMIEHRAAVNLVHGLRDLVYRDLAEHGPLRVALIASPVFDASVQQLFPALLFGHELCIVPDDVRRDGEALCDVLRDWRIDVSDATPSLLRIMLRGGIAERCGGSLRHLLVGGEALPRALVRELHASAPGRRIRVTNVYGPTECCVDVLAHRVDPDDPSSETDVPIGRPMRNCTAWVVDADGRPLPPGAIGELAIGGTCLGRGYVNDPKLTQQRFAALPAPGAARAYRTGDRARASIDGVFTFLGRDDDQVKIRGHRIELGEIEHHLRTHPAIRDVSVQARTTADGERELVAYVVGGEVLTLAALRAFATARMPVYMIPASFVPLPALPLNVSGKVARELLPDPADVPGLPSGVAHQPPSTPAETALWSVWTRTLGRPDVGIHDDYFAGGGDSIKALQLAARLREAGWVLQIRDLFVAPTIAELAPRLRPCVHETTVAHAPDTGVSALSATQRFFFATYGACAHYNQALLLRVRRPLPLAALRAVCGALAAQHAMLRARFVHEPTGWRQEVLPPEAVELAVAAVDLRDRPAPDAMLTHAADSQTRFRLEHAPLWSAVLYDVPDGQRLLLSAHHAIVDGVSWRIVIDDLERLLHQHARGEAFALPPRSARYADWVAEQERAAATPLRAERAYWSCDAAPAPAPTADRQADRREVRLVLPRDRTRALLTDAHRAYATEINDLLVAAVACGWRAWTGERECGLTLEGHGRESTDGEIDLSRTIGWFTSLFPVRIRLPEAAEAGAAITRTKEILRSVPGRGAAYGVLRYVAAARDLLPLPPLAFNYLGQFDTAGDGWFERAPEPGPVTAAADAPFPWPLELTAAVVDDCMELTLAYTARRYVPSEARAFLDHVGAALEAIVQHTLQREHVELSASDFDYAELTQDGLDEFLRTLT